MKEKSGKLWIISKSTHWVAIEKPAGWLTTPSRLGAEDERPCLGRELERELGCRVWPVHRLDQEVSGLVLFALSADAHRALSGAFEGRSVRKHYHARCELRPEARVTEGKLERWESRMLRGKRRAYVDPRGKECVTEARVVRVEGAVVELELWPLTGRPHQLRVECAQHGMPILGDVLYGAQERTEEGIALRAVSLDFSDWPEHGRWELPEQLTSASDG